MSRYFELKATKKNGARISAAEAQEIKQELEENYVGGWDGTLDQKPMACWDASWSDWNEDMTAIAMKHSDIIFTLLCLGDDLDDTWHAGFCGDRFDAKEAVLPPLDMGFLRDD